MRQAIAIIVQRQEKLLFIQRAETEAFAGYWSPVTGGVEAGETLEQTVVREAIEEMDLQIRPLREVWECQIEYGDIRLHWFLTQYLSGGDKPNPAEVAEARWLPLQDYFQLSPRFDSHAEFFQSILPPLLHELHKPEK